MRQLKMLKSKALSKKRRERLRSAIEAIMDRKEYPSAIRINKELGRRTKTLNGSECIARREIFRELGIELMRIGWSDYEDPTIW